MSDYKSQIEQAYKNKVLGTLDRVTRTTALDLHGDLVTNTPVGNPDLWKSKPPKGYVGGAARSNWLPSIGIARGDTTDEKNGSPKIDFSGYKLGQTIFMANNLPYIISLNNGSSKQADAGFIDDAILRAIRNAKRYTQR